MEAERQITDTEILQFFSVLIVSKMSPGSAFVRLENTTNTSLRAYSGVYVKLSAANSREFCRLALPSKILNWHSFIIWSFAASLNEESILAPSLKVAMRQILERGF